MLPVLQAHFEDTHIRHHDVFLKKEHLDRVGVKPVVEGSAQEIAQAFQLFLKLGQLDFNPFLCACHGYASSMPKSTSSESIVTGPSASVMVGGPPSYSM